jgi:hypothetical protein
MNGESYRLAHSKARRRKAASAGAKSRPGKFGQRAKWKICLKAVKMPRIRRRDDKTDTQKSRAGL